jgi:IS30 family transposase
MDLVEKLNENRREANRYLTLEERRGIKKFLDLGYTFEKIGNEVGRSKWTVRNEINRNGGRFAYDPREAHKSFESRHWEGQKKVAATKGSFEHSERSLAWQNPLKSHIKGVADNLEEKIGALSMQIDILLDLIRSKDDK